MVEWTMYDSDPGWTPAVPPALLANITVGPSLV